MPTAAYPEAFHEYVESIMRLSKQKPGTLVTNLDIAKDLDIKPPSVSEMIPKLEEAKLVVWEKRKGVKLTEQGVKLASLVMQQPTAAQARKTAERFMDERFPELAAEL